jgi:hypothetical protein
MPSVDRPTFAGFSDACAARAPAPADDRPRRELLTTLALFGEANYATKLIQRVS